MPRRKATITLAQKTAPHFNSKLSQRRHTGSLVGCVRTCFCAHTLQFGTTSPRHQLGNFPQVDAAVDMARGTKDKRTSNQYIESRAANMYAQGTCKIRANRQEWQGTAYHQRTSTRVHSGTSSQQCAHRVRFILRE